MSVCQLSALPLDGVVMDPTEIRYIFWASEPPELLLRHCQARTEVRAVAPDDQTVFCLINNSYNCRERTGGWRWWRVLECWSVGVEISYFSCTGATTRPVTRPVRARSINMKTRCWLPWICRIRDTAMQVGALGHSARRPESS